MFALVCCIIKMLYLILREGGMYDNDLHLNSAVQSYTLYMYLQQFIENIVFLSDLGIRCGFDQLDKAHLTVTPKRTEYHYGEVVSLQCNEGFVLRGPSTVSCTEDRLFDVPSNLACEGNPCQ